MTTASPAEEADYKEFCRLRDYRKPGAEVPQYTEAEAFALAIQTDAENRKKKCFAT
ncbi:hypothetical protein [Janthinobacterium sp. NKUCC06_STL]|uniref:hypothetical protein n=1 Tax=Janthinobacterium sp. NKUCC06_STL TaxID=2842127 RepID=UPI001C5B8271|nr:hypothetical protein [Janthinobacterium sp. NKUCC06_STL]MBW3513048.1 hypothetical protein [Janthinobacterium sp. NKUCC06_STL]